ncbi:MAG: response regulator [Chloroflexota bacterium]|nr:response regulator [Chloroflexota bacterium]
MSSTASDAAHVLVVDHEPSIRTVFSDILEDEGYPVVCVTNGQEALHYLTHHAQVPCLILLDLNMPIMSGWDFRRAQLADPQLAAIPVVAVSAGATVRQQATNIRADGHVAKPVDYDALVTTVAHYCTHRA